MQGEREAIWFQLRRAALVAGAAFASAAPHVYYVSRVAFGDRLMASTRGLSGEDLIRADLSAMAVVCVIAALAGSLFARRYRLPGLGQVADLWRGRWVILGAGPIVMLVSYLAFGRAIAEAVPGYFPSSPSWALALTINGAVFDEVVERYGMMTICAGFSRHLAMANLIQATFFTLVVGMKTMSFFGLHAGWTFAFVAGIVAAFGRHLLQGLVYARFGLLTAMALHWIIDLQMLLHALL